MKHLSTSSQAASLRHVVFTAPGRRRPGCRRRGQRADQDPVHRHERRHHGAAYTQYVFPAFEKANNVKVVVVPGTSSDILAKAQANKDRRRCT
jgi:hypothetical protein